MLKEESWSKFLYIDSPALHYLILSVGVLARLYFATSTIGVESWGHYIFYRTVKEGHILDFYKFNLDDPLSIYVYGPVWMSTMVQYSWTDFTTPTDPGF